MIICPTHHRMVHRGEMGAWRLRWYNRRSSIIASLKALLPFAFRRPKRPTEQILEVASGRKRWLALGILLLMIAGCLVVTIVVFFWS